MTPFENLKYDHSKSVPEISVPSLPRRVSEDFKYKSLLSTQRQKLLAVGGNGNTLKFLFYLYT